MTTERVSSIDSAPPEGHIELDHVNFHYPSCPDVPIVKDLSVALEANKRAPSSMRLSLGRVVAPVCLFAV